MAHCGGNPDSWLVDAGIGASHPEIKTLKKDQYITLTYNSHSHNCILCLFVFVHSELRKMYFYVVLLTPQNSRQFSAVALVLSLDHWSTCYLLLDCILPQASVVWSFFITTTRPIKKSPFPPPPPFAECGMNTSSSWKQASQPSLLASRQFLSKKINK